MTETDLILQWSFAALVGLVLLSRRQLTWFHPAALYLALHVVLFCIRPTLIHLMDLDAVWKRLEFTPDPEDMRLALGVSSAALAAFVGACLLATRRAAPLDLPEIRAADSSDIRALIFTAILFVPPALHAVVAASPDAVGVHGHSSVSVFSGDTWGLSHALTPIAVVTLFVARWRWWSLLPFLACVALAVHRHGGSWILLPSALLVVLAWLWYHQRRSLSSAAILGFIMLLAAAFSVANDPGRVRDWFTGAETQSIARGEDRTLRDRLDGAELAAFDGLTHLIATVPGKTQAYTRGSQHLPSFAWSEDDRTPIRVGVLTASADRAALPRSVVADGWLSGGWYGVIITLILLGGALGLAYSHFTRHATAAGPACFFLIIHAGALSFHRDATSPVLPLLVFTFAPLYVWTVIAGRLRRSRETAEQREQLRGRREQRRILGHAVIDPAPAPLPAGLFSDDTGEPTPSDAVGSTDATEADGVAPADPVDGPPHTDPPGDSKRALPRWRDDSSP